MFTSTLPLENLCKRLRYYCSGYLPGHCKQSAGRMDLHSCDEVMSFFCPAVIGNQELAGRYDGSTFTVEKSERRNVSFMEGAFRQRSFLNDAIDCYSLNGSPLRQD